MTLPIYARVHLAGHPGDTAIVTAVHECPEPGCTRPAYSVRRDPGSFTTWATDDGLFHAADCATVALDVADMVRELVAKLRELGGCDDLVAELEYHLSLTREERRQWLEQNGDQS